MARGRKITLYLADGTPNGIMKGQIGNWVGLVTYAPRTRLDGFGSDKDTHDLGVYVLTGPHPEDISSRAVYIGESENVFKRLLQHERDETKSFFEHMAVITSTDGQLTKAHIRYLESRLIAIAHETKRAVVLNGTQPASTPLPPADRDEMEFFLEHLEMLLPVFGLSFILPRPKVKIKSENIDDSSDLDSPLFKLTTTERKTGISVEASAQLIENEFVILKDSQALARDRSQSYKDLKARLLKNGVLIQQGQHFLFTEDTPFSSPSAAAVAITGRNTNGRTAWLTDQGVTFDEWFNEKLEKQIQADSEYD